MEKEEKGMKGEELKKSKIFKIWMKILATPGYLDLEGDKQGGFWVEPVSENNAAAHSPVSYTHLTLPTIYSV